MRKTLAALTLCLLIINGQAFAEQRRTTDDISMLNRYYYRLANRAAAIDPGKRYSGNFKPISIRESVSLFNNRESLKFLEDRTHRYYNPEECEKHPDGFTARPLKELHAVGTYTDEEDAPLPSSFGFQVDGNYYGALFFGGNAYYKDCIMGAYNLRASNDDMDGPVDFFGYKLKTGFKHISIAAAKESVVVGPGFFGNLLLSDNVEPENSIIIKTEMPYDWGWLGAFRWYAWHVWYEDEERYNKNPRLLGGRVSLMPWNVVELGISRTALYGGSRDRSFDSLEIYWDMFTAVDENVNSNPYNSQQQASFDLSINLPFLKNYSPFKGGKAYIDFAFTDARVFYQTEEIRRNLDTVFKPLGTSYLYGLFLTTGRTDVSIEYFDISGRAYSGGASNFKEMGYADKGYILGHFAGQNSHGVMGEVYHELYPWIHLYGGIGYLERLDNQYGDHQIENDIFSGLAYFMSDKLSISLRCGYSEFDKTDINPSPVKSFFSDEEYSNTVITVTLDYQF